MVRVLVSGRWGRQLAWLEMVVVLVLKIVGMLVLVIMRYGSADVVMAGQGRTAVAIHPVLLLVLDRAAQDGTGPVVVLEREIAVVILMVVVARFDDHQTALPSGIPPPPPVDDQDDQAGHQDQPRDHQQDDDGDGQRQRAKQVRLVETGQWETAERWRTTARHVDDDDGRTAAADGRRVIALLEHVPQPEERAVALQRIVGHVEIIQMRPVGRMVMAAHVQRLERVAAQIQTDQVGVQSVEHTQRQVIPQGVVGHHQVDDGQNFDGQRGRRRRSDGRAERSVGGRPRHVKNGRINRAQIFHVGNVESLETRESRQEVGRQLSPQIARKIQMGHWRKAGRKSLDDAIQSIETQIQRIQGDERVKGQRIDTVDGVVVESEEAQTGQVAESSVFQRLNQVLAEVERSQTGRQRGQGRRWNVTQIVVLQPQRVELTERVEGSGRHRLDLVAAEDERDKGRQFDEQVVRQSGESVGAEIEDRQRAQSGKRFHFQRRDQIVGDVEPLELAQRLEVEQTQRVENVVAEIEAPQLAVETDRLSERGDPVVGQMQRAQRRIQKDRHRVQPRAGAAGLQ